MVLEGARDKAVARRGAEGMESVQGDKMKSMDLKDRKEDRRAGAEGR